MHECCWLELCFSRIVFFSLVEYTNVLEGLPSFILKCIISQIFRLKEFGCKNFSSAGSRALFWLIFQM